MLCIVGFYMIWCFFCLVNSVVLFVLLSMTTRVLFYLQVWFAVLVLWEFCYLGLLCCTFRLGWWWFCFCSVLGWWFGCVAVLCLGFYYFCLFDCKLLVFDCDDLTCGGFGAVLACVGLVVVLPTGFPVWLCFCAILLFCLPAVWSLVMVLRV